MSATLTMQTASVNANLPCAFPSCERHARPLYDQLSAARYTFGVSLLAIPNTLEEWRAEHRTARRRALRAERLGYQVGEVSYSDHADDIFAINTSLPERQGRPMSDGYTTRRHHGRLSEDQTRCPQHRTHTFGVSKRGRLLAYLTLHRAGDLAMVSMILGHGDHLDDGIMFLLFQGVVGNQAGMGGWFYYNRHDSGRDGLVWMKERLGFAAGDVEWTL